MRFGQRIPSILPIKGIIIDIMKTMKTKTILTAIITSVVVVGTSMAIATQSSWQPPTRPFPDLGGIVAPLDEGANVQSRNGVIDFSASPTPTTFAFGANQGIILPSTSAFKISSGDFKIAMLGRGVVFPDGTKQTTAAGGMFKLGKLCQVVGSGWNNTTLAPDSWAVNDCNQFAIKMSGSNYQIGCALSSGTSFGAAGGAFPSPNCGWNASCSSSGLYYPYAPVGCANPQKVIAGANQASVSGGTANVTYTPTDTVVSGVGACWHFLNNAADCTKDICSTPTTAYAANLTCGAYVYDNQKSSAGASCGTGNIYQVYCR